MEEIDEESFRRVPGELGSEADPPHTGTGREERRRESPGQGIHVEVRGLDAAARSSIREELQLLAALEVAGTTAAPSVLEIEDDGYLRESASPLERRSGRRAAEDGAPPTAERLALARARDDLDDLIDALHQRGWVLGARPGQGLGVRPDGSVVVLEVDGLQRLESLSARQGDRRWVDSVLEDQARTLRRRINLVPSSWPLGEHSLLAPGPAPGAQPHARHATAGPEAEFEVAGQAVAEGEAAGGAVTGGAVAGEAVAGEMVAEPARAALPPPRQIRRRRGEGPAQEDALGRHAPHPATLWAAIWDRGLSAIRQVLSQPPLRRVAVGSALVVLLLGSTAAVGAWWAHERPAQTPGQEQHPVATAEPSSEFPPIEDPWVLVADVAGARHAYVTGVSEQSAAVPGSEAFAADEETRSAYRDYQVRGGGPVVHTAELLEGPDAAGTAVLRAVTSTAEHELEDHGGGITTIPATAPREVRLTLHWDGEQWLIESAEPVGAEASGG